MGTTTTRPEEPRLIPTLGGDVREVWTQVGRTGVKRTFTETFTDLQEFYLTTHRRDRLAGMGPVKRTLLVAVWLLKALFLKLTPSRRLLLLLSFYLMWQGNQLRIATDSARISIDFPFVAIGVLLLILMLELKDKLLARTELEAGRVVQLALMPDHAPVFPGWDVWLFTRSANDVGGDLVDYLQIDARRLAVTLGDVAGKGLPAALLMAKLQATIRALASLHPSLGELGAEVNRILSRDGLSNRFATLIYLELVPDSGRVRLLNAGHMPPLVVRRGGVEETARGNVALGIVPEAAFIEQQVELGAGETLVVYSDGVSEAMNGAGDFFGDERIKVPLTTTGVGATAEATGKALLAAVDGFMGDNRASDDLSLLVVKRLASPEAPVIQRDERTQPAAPVM